MITDYVMSVICGTLNDPYKETVLVHGETGIEAIKDYFENIEDTKVSVKKGKGNDINCQLIPIIIKDGLKYKHPTKIISWYKIELL